MEHGPLAQEYIRGLDLETAVSVVQYRMTADAPRALSFTLRMEPRQPSGFRITCQGQTLTLAGALPETWLHNQEHGSVLHGNRMKYEAQTYVQAPGGTVTAGADWLRVQNADSVLILFTAGTDYIQDYDREYKGVDPHISVTRRLEHAGRLGYSVLPEHHLADYCPLYQRVRLDLGQKHPSVTTAELIDSYALAPEPDRRWIEVLVFHMGRYLLLSSSRSGSLPANLQGIWNPMISPTWESDYHINIKLEMNYWMADLLNMPEPLQPLTDFLMDLQKAGTITAEEIYGFRDGSPVIPEALEDSRFRIFLKAGNVVTVDFSASQKV